MDQFLNLLASAIATNRVYVESLDGRKSPAWGYEKDGTFRGKLIRWRDGSNLYLDPDASFDAAREVGGNYGAAIRIAQKSLHKRLHERGLLVSTEVTNRTTLTVRKMIHKVRKSVLHLC